MKLHRTIAAALTSCCLLTACAAPSSSLSPNVAPAVTPTAPAVQPGAATEALPKRHGFNVWINRPWEARYVLFITQQWPIWKKGAIKRNRTAEPWFVQWPAIFEPSVMIPTPGEYSPDPLWAVVIEFDADGKVLTPHTHGSPLRGRLNEIRRLTMSAGDGPVDPQYDLGHWFTGLGDVSTHWAPGVCSLKESPSPFSKTDTLYLYGPKFEIDEYSSTFGCREWAYQLYDDERPYIDVTSYIRQGKTYPKYTAIRDVIGWARFGDKKPVIGQHDGRWYCLHDCPGGVPPGFIEDIKGWSAKQGWRVPRPPTKAPTFPDPPASQGRYPK